MMLYDKLYHSYSCIAVDITFGLSCKMLVYFEILTLEDIVITFTAFQLWFSSVLLDTLLCRHVTINEETSELH